jgi:hypothetical protein
MNQDDWLARAVILVVEIDVARVFPTYVNVWHIEALSIHYYKLNLKPSDDAGVLDYEYIYRYAGARCECRGRLARKGASLEFVKPASL